MMDRPEDRRAEVLRRLRDPRHPKDHGVFSTVADLYALTDANAGDLATVQVTARRHVFVFTDTGWTVTGF